MDFHFDKWRMAYCYSSECPSRTKEKPYPYGEIVMRGEETKCPHCGLVMTIVANSSDLD